MTKRFRHLALTLIIFIVASVPVAAQGIGGAGEVGAFGTGQSEPSTAPVPAGRPHPAAVTLGDGAIMGRVFFDSDGNGLYDRPADERGLAGVAITLVDSATQGAVYAASTATASDGAYIFAQVPDGAYTVTHGAAATGYTPVTANPTPALVSGGTVTIDFAVTYLLTLTGVVFEDVNGDGFRGLGEPTSPAAVVELYRDVNSNGKKDPTEGRYAYTLSDSMGNYLFEGLLAGDWVLVTQLNGGAGAAERHIRLFSGEAGALIRYLDVPVTPIGPTGAVTGIVWNDGDGDELVEDDEARFANVTIYLYKDANGNRAVDNGEMLAGKTLTDDQGHYAVSNLAAGAYVLQVDEGTLPGNFVPSSDPTALAFTLAAGVTRTVNIGYYDPLVVAPWRVADWKREVSQIGQPYYTPAQLQAFITAVEAASDVFAEGISVADALFKAAKSEEARARKEHAALSLNVASARLLPMTPVNLPELTGATTVAAAVAEIEALLWPPASQPNDQYQRARALAHQLNNNKGLGYGLSGAATLLMADYRGANITKKLAADGDDVDQYMDQPIYLRRWNFKDLGPNTQVFEPTVKIKVNQFHNGGILEVLQVLPDGRELSLGLAAPAVWNKAVNATFTFHLRNVPTVAELTNLQLRLYVRDPDMDGGPKEHVRVDSVVLDFGY